MTEAEWMQYCISKRHEVEILYTIRMKLGFHVNETINLDNPQTINEKLNWLKIYDSTYLKTRCCDKIELHNYCKEKLGKDICIPIIKTYNNFDEINFDELPENYVLKTNHGSTTNIFVKNRNIDKIQAKIKFEDWLSHDWTFWGLEMFYERVPRKIFAEQFMENDDKHGLIDYKFWCFNGEPKFMIVVDDRFKSNMHFTFYDMNLNKLKIREILHEILPYNIKSPKCFEEMKSTARIFALDFKFVRVDFYEINGKLYLGELTFCPSAGYIKYEDPNDQKRIGDLLKL